MRRLLFWTLPHWRFWAVAGILLSLLGLHPLVAGAIAAVCWNLSRLPTDRGL